LTFSEVPPPCCEDCGDALRETERAGLCSSCVPRRRARYQAGYYAAMARNGQVVDEEAVESFRHLLPAALARKGLRLEREVLAWVVRVAVAEPFDTFVARVRAVDAARTTPISARDCEEA
jgi:hypothetical protein